MPPEASEPSRAKSSPGPLAQSLLIGGLAYTLLGSHVVDIFFLNPFIFLDVYHAPLILALLSAAFGIPFWLVCILLNRGGTTGTLGLRCSLVAMLLLNLWVLIRVHLGGVIREPSSVGPATAAILAIAVTAMFLLRHRTSNLVAISWIFLASVVIGNVYAIGLYVVAPALESAETVHEFSNVPAASPDRPHVFHILFDGMPGVSMQGEGELASQAFYRRAPSGVFYTNVFAQADYTSASIPQITRGIFAYRERLTTESLGESFLRAGYHVRLYMDFTIFHCSGTGRGAHLTHEMPYDECFDKQWLIESVPALSGFEGTSGFQAHRLFNAYLSRIGKDDLAAGVSRLLLVAETSQEEAQRKQTKRSVMRNRSTTLALRDKFLDDLEHLKQPTYHFIHLPIPHPPRIFDRDCNLVGATNSIMKSYMVASEDRQREHTLCANKMAGQLIERLQQLGLYESSFIIIHSDHGEHAPEGGYRAMSLDRLKQSLAIPEGETRRELDAGFDMRARPVLWLKPPRFQRKEERPHLALLLDIPATLRAFLGRRISQEQGLDLLAHEPEVYQERKVYLHGTTWSGEHFFAHRNGSGRWELVEPEEAIESSKVRFK